MIDVPVKELLEPENRQGKPQLSRLSLKLALITGARASNSDSIGESASHGAASGTDEMTVSDLIEKLQAVVDQASAIGKSRTQSDPGPRALRANRNDEPTTSRSQSDPIKREAVCIITGLGKVTGELPLKCIQNRQSNYSNPNILNRKILTL